jgi:holliday junction resolvase YEN1
MLLIRTLMQTAYGQERSNNDYDIKIEKQKDSTTVKATFLLSAATSLDMGQYAKNKGGSFYDNEFRASCETLPWILQRGVPEAVAAREAEKPGKSAKGRKMKATKIKIGNAAASQSGNTVKVSGKTGAGKKRGQQKRT